MPRLLLPDLAAMLTTATLFYCLFVFGAGTQFFRDSDSGWHIRNGERILAGRTLPRADPYSFTKAGEPWIAWEWGADVLMGAVHRIDGMRGLVFLFALAVSACIWLCAKLHFVAGGNFFLPALFAPLTVTTASLHWLARPHVLSWLFLLAALLYAERAPVRFGPRQVVLVTGATALWANMHASFLLAPAIAVAYAVGHLVRPLVWPLSRGAEFARARWFLCAALAALAGSLLNPYGWRLPAHVLAFLGNTELTSRVAEFQSFNFQQKGAAQVALVVALSMAGCVLALSQKKVAHFMILAALAWGGLRSARVLPLVALAGLPLANGAFTQALERWRGLRAGLERSLGSVLAYSARLRSFDRRVTGAVFLATVVLLAFAVIQSPVATPNIGFSPSQFPVGAASVVETLPAQARILAPDSYGGYLIYRFAGARKVFVDGRSDFYGADFMNRYLDLMSARPGWRDVARSFGFTDALLPNQSPLASALEQAGWHRIYKDGIATLLEAR